MALYKQIKSHGICVMIKVKVQFLVLPISIEQIDEMFQSGYILIISPIQDADAKLLSQNDFINDSFNNRKVFMPASYVCSQVGLKCLQNFQEFIICTSKAFNKLGY